MIFAPKIPLKFDNSYGYDNVSGLKELAKFHLKNLLFTFPGEKISDPEYGVGVEKYLFENPSGGELNNIATEVSDAIKRYLPYLNLMDVVVLLLEEGLGINIKIYYSFQGASVSDTLSLNVSNSSKSY